VHEAYIKLIDQNRVNWKTRTHFCGVAAQLMRRVLMEHARAHNGEKRGGKMEKLYLDETRELSQERAPDLIALDFLSRNWQARRLRVPQARCLCHERSPIREICGIRG
jgi:ECF sigma factor